MARYSDRITRPLTLKYVFALGLLAVLAITNFLLLRSEILSGQAMASILNNSGRQRMLLHRTAMLAERLVFASEPALQAQLRRELSAATEPLEKTHFDLMLPDSVEGPAPPEQIRAIYEDVPYLLDSEMRNYMLHLQSIAKAPHDELHYGNAHFKYVRSPETIDKILKGLDAVVDVYQQASDAKTAHLRLLAIWSLASTLVVLLLDGWFVFRTMVHRVREDVDDLNELNETLDKRVADRSAEAKQRAEQLATSESALRDSEVLYRSLVNNLPMCVLRKDTEGRFTFANHQYCQLVGRPFDQIAGRTDDDLYSPQMAAKYKADDRRVIETQHLFQSIERHQASGCRELHVEVFKTPVCDAAGTVIGTQTMFWDVTDRVEAEQRARHAERLAAIGQMLAGVAHESRNALQQLQACTRLLEWELDGDSSKQELFVDLQIAQDRLHRLFDDLREFASPLKLDLRPCNANALVEQAWTSLEINRRNRDASLQHTSDPSSPNCLADPFQLEQVFRNILENSLAACEDPVRMEVDYDEVSLNGQTMLHVTIRDNGPGLSQRQQEQIFEPFFTTKTQGTGLGMSIVRQIVNAHGGTIEVQCGRLGGTEVMMTLPHSSAWSPANRQFAEGLHA